MNRGFEKISSQIDNPNVVIPQRQTKHSVGYDLATPYEVLLPAGQTTVIKTGIKAFFGEDEVMYIFPRSSLGIKKNITLANSVAVFECDYYNNPDNEGEILIALRNNNANDIILPVGERIAQCVFQKFLIADNEITPEQTRIGGVGSTGK